MVLVKGVRGAAAAAAAARYKLPLNVSYSNVQNKLNLNVIKLLF